MPDLPSLLSYLPTIWTAVTGLLGGGAAMGLVKAYRTYHNQSRQDAGQAHDHNLELSDRLETRLSKVEGRLDAAEDELRGTKKELTQSRIREEELQAAINALVQRIDRLIDRLEQHEQISEEERKNLTSVPFDDSRTE